MERYDVAVIGTGPAGLEAAITAKIRNKSVLLLGSKELSPKINNAHTIKNYLGFPDLSGEKMQESFEKHLKSLEISITEDRANTVYAMGDYFAIQGHKEMYESSSVILACGVSASKPLPGELENLGRGVSYCATCDAALYKNKSAIVIGYSKEDENEAEFLSEIANKVYYLPMYQSDISLNDKIKVVLDEKPSSINKLDNKMQLVTENLTLEADGVFTLRKDVAPFQLVPGLNVEDSHVVVDRNMKTNISGLFACGDITGAPYQYIKAAGEGNVAALSAVKFLMNNKNN